MKVIIEFVKIKDFRLIGKIILVGSFYFDFKIGLLDEFDFIYELQIFEEGIDFELMLFGFKGI